MDRQIIEVAILFFYVDGRLRGPHLMVSSWLRFKRFFVFVMYRRLLRHRLFRCFHFAPEGTQLLLIAAMVFKMRSKH